MNGQICDVIGVEQGAGGGVVEGTGPEERVDILRRGAELRGSGVPGEHDVLGAILLGIESDGAGLDAERDVLGDEDGVGTVGTKVERAGEDARVVPGVAESGGKHPLVGVIEFHAQRAALGGDLDVSVQPAVAGAEFLQLTEGFSREVAEFRVVAFALELADDGDGQDDLVFGESADRPRIGEQHRSVEDVSTNGLCHGNLLAPGRPRASLVSDYLWCGPNVLGPIRKPPLVASYKGHATERG